MKSEYIVHKAIQQKIHMIKNKSNVNLHFDILSYFEVRNMAVLEFKKLEGLSIPIRYIQFIMSISSKTGKSLKIACIFLNPEYYITIVSL